MVLPIPGMANPWHTKNSNTYYILFLTISNKTIIFFLIYTFMRIFNNLLAHRKEIKKIRLFLACHECWKTLPFLSYTNKT